MPVPSGIEKGGPRPKDNVLPFTLLQCIMSASTVHPVNMGRAQLAATVSLLAAGLSLSLGFRGAELWAALLVGLGLALSGYAWMTHRILAREDPRAVPELTRGPGDLGLGHTAVIYFTHGEPETHDPIGWSSGRSRKRSTRGRRHREAPRCRGEAQPARSIRLGRSVLSMI